MTTTDNTQYETIPQPPQHLMGLLGNLPDIDPAFELREIWRLQQLYGPIMKLNLNGDRVYVATQKLTNEVCDQSRFHKVVSHGLNEVRALLGDGLFTAYKHEPNWGKAHRMLTPAFGPIGIRKMFDDMQDIASQMVLRWDRLGPEHEIDCSDDLTRLAFDTIGLCAFSFRFNEFYTNDAHPFAQQMADVLLESGKRAARPKIMQPLYRSSEQKRQEQVKAMWHLCDEVVADRKKNPRPYSHDLLNAMLNTVDRETGEGLSDENIRYQMATFLVAGHETTSATLSFTYLNLIKNPECLLKAQKQVDEVVGDSVLTVDHISKLDYIDACIKETLRFSAPIGIITVESEEDQVIDGTYLVPKGTPVSVNIRLLHRDKEAWGDDAEVFRPERWLNGGLQALPPNSWKPFGNGMRACIGRGFAEQEMIMNIAMVLQRFQIELADPTYDLQLKSTLTIKPNNFKMKVRRRAGKSLYTGIPGGMHSPRDGTNSTKAHHSAHKPAADGEKKSLAVYFGGSTGTCEALAQALQTAANDHGFDTTIASLDAATELVPTDQPVVIITSSYEGLPPDNAKKFVQWLEGLDSASQSLKDVKLAVYGVGNSDWANTFHRVPRLVDELTAKNGATKIIEAGYSNVKEDPIGPWDEWLDKLLEALSGGTAPSAKVTLEAKVERNPLGRALGGSEMNLGTVVENKELADTAVGPAKRHLVIGLPQDAEYNAGDYLVVQPHNPIEAVRRVSAFFGLHHHDVVSFAGSAKKFLPSEPVSVAEFLSSAVELASPVTKRQLERIAEHGNAEAKAGIEKMIQDYQTILQKRYSIIDVLEDHAVTLPFADFVDMLSPLAPRQYSISSSPLVQPECVSLTIDVHESPAFSGHGIFQGVASTYLATRRVGDRISCFVRETNVGFRIPSAEVPLIMVAAGTGIAPMRAFLQERAAIADAGVRQLGPAVLYFGCRDEDKDFIYKDELREWEKKGVVKVKPAFSKHGGDGPHYVQDLLLEDQDQIAEMFLAGGKIFLCGSAARLGKSCAEACKKIYCDRTGKSEDEAEQWLQSVKTDRFVSDVY